MCGRDSIPAECFEHTKGKRRKIAIFLGDVLGELGDGGKSTKEKRKSENKTLECTRRTFETSKNFGRSVKVLPVSRRDNTHGIY